MKKEKEIFKEVAHNAGRRREYYMWAIKGTMASPAIELALSRLGDGNSTMILDLITRTIEGQPLVVVAILAAGAMGYRYLRDNPSV